MEIVTLVVILVVFLVITPIMHGYSRELRKITSLEEDLALFEEYPEDATVTKNWTFGWKFEMKRKLDWWLVNTFGDRLVSLYFELQGYLIMVILVLMWMTFALILVQTINI